MHERRLRELPVEEPESDEAGSRMQCDTLLLEILQIERESLIQLRNDAATVMMLRGLSKGIWICWKATCTQDRQQAFSLDISELRISDEESARINEQVLRHSVAAKHVYSSGMVVSRAPLLLRHRGFDGALWARDRRLAKN